MYSIFRLTLTWIQSSIAAVISAWQSACKIIHTIKAKRKAKKAPPMLTELERSVNEAPDEIEAEKQRGVSRFGRAFEEGDYIAVVAIQHATISLQSDLLEKLHLAAMDDAVTDFTELADTSHLARNALKSALFEFYRRKKEGTNLPSVMEMLRLNGGISVTGPRLDVTKESAVKVIELNCAPMPDNHTHVRSKQSHSRKWPLVSLRRNSKTQSLGENQNIAPERSNAQANRILTEQKVGISQALLSVRAPQIAYELEEDSQQVWGNVHTTSTADGVAIIPSNGRSRAANFRMPTSQNSYLGFCKAAWKLQNGDHKALRVTNLAQNSHTQRIPQDLLCSSCSYRCPMTLDVFWKKVRTLAPRGISYRWSFMAKSHVPHKQRGSPDYSYMCLFCAFLGLEMSLFKLGTLFDHISSEHRGTDLSEVVLNRTNCVNDRICGDDEEYEINLWPLVDNEASNFRRTSLTSTVTATSTSSSQEWEKFVSEAFAS